MFTRSLRHASVGVLSLAISMGLTGCGSSETDGPVVMTDAQKAQQIDAQKATEAAFKESSKAKKHSNVQKNGRAVNGVPTS